MTDTVPFGTPITTEQATAAVLRLIESPLLPATISESEVGAIFALPVYLSLSRGERALMDIAFGLYRGGDQGARIGDLGKLDKNNRRKVLLILFYRYLGRDLTALECLNSDEFALLFGAPPLPVE